MRFCFDLDGTLCKGLPYEGAEPLPGARELLLRLKEKGHTIIIQTARGMGTSAGNQGTALSKIGLLTFEQLQRWGFVYDELWFGKPAADKYIDDKSCQSILDLLEDPALCQII
jgi:hydroxymethylpyrimidine pyrophosphatase-like HAD family hydrolase